MPSHDGVRPSLTLTPGLRLRTEAGVALHELEQAGDEAAARVRDNLRGALAYTAAVGESCLIAPAVEAVRAAVASLAAGLLSQACLSLSEALGWLSPMSPHLGPTVPDRSGGPARVGV